MRVLAAPILAGVLATFMSHGGMPFTTQATSNRDFVRRAESFIRNSANWMRPSGYKVLWNGVVQEVHDALCDG